MRPIIALMSICFLFATGFAANFSVKAEAALTTETLNYKAGETNLIGSLVYDNATQAKRPAILVVHEWYGLNEHSKNAAGHLAQQGYTALAVDMYGDGRVTTNPQEAGVWADQIRGNPQIIRERLQAALDALKQHPTVDPNRISAIGFCFGGTVVLEAARMGMDLDGVVGFHGGLKSSVPQEQRKLQSRVLVLNGAIDPAVPQEDIAAFIAEMEAAKADWQMNNYGGAVHAFTNPAADSPPRAKYHPLAAKRSFQAMDAFFNEIYKKQ